MGILLAFNQIAPLMLRATQRNIPVVQHLSRQSLGTTGLLRTSRQVKTTSSSEFSCASVGVLRDVPNRQSRKSRARQSCNHFLDLRLCHVDWLIVPPNGCLCYMPPPSGQNGERIRMNLVFAQVLAETMKNEAIACLFISEIFSAE